MMKKRCSRILLSLTFLLVGGLGYADTYEMDAVITRQILPDTPGLQNQVIHYEDLLKAGNLDPAISTLLNNTKSILKNGMVYSIPAKLYVEVNSQTQSIDKYRIEYIRPVIGSEDPGFTVENPIIHFDDDCVLLCDNNTIKKVEYALDMKSNEKFTREMSLGDCSIPETAMMIMGFLSQCKELTPLRQIELADTKKTTYDLAGREIEIVEKNGGKDMEISGKTIAGYDEFFEIAFFDTPRIPRYVKGMMTEYLETTVISPPKKVVDRTPEQLFQFE